MADGAVLRVTRSWGLGWISGGAPLLPGFHSHSGEAIGFGACWGSQNNGCCHLWCVLS